MDDKQNKELEYTIDFINEIKKIDFVREIQEVIPISSRLDEEIITCDIDDNETLHCYSN